MASPSSPSMPNPSVDSHMPVVLLSTLSPVNVKLDRANCYYQFVHLISKTSLV